MKSQFKSPVLYTEELPPREHFPEETVLLYDSVLAKNKAVKAWLNRFEYRLSLKSGESLKSLKSFEQILNKISAMSVPNSTSLTFVAVGGGSVGDFTGFIASVYKRGRKLVNVPSTWLAAVDSAHGGKNGLNLQKTKNQIGTIYPASEIWISHELLLTQPKVRLQESLGEIIKIALLSDAKLFNLIEKQAHNWDAGQMLKYLPHIIDLKYRIVQKDPFEKTGVRRLLNLGHTMGHVFESHYGWAHGTAVLIGIQFSARWSFHRGFLNEKDFFKISILIDSLTIEPSLNAALRDLKSTPARRLLMQDKKMTGKSQMDFIFIESIGRCSRHRVTVDEVLQEMDRQRLEY